MDRHNRIRAGGIVFCNLAHICYLIGLMLNQGDAHYTLATHELAVASPSKHADDARSDFQVGYGTGQRFFHQRETTDESSNFPIYSTTEINLVPYEEGETDILQVDNIGIKKDRTKIKAIPQSSKRGWEDFIRCSCCRGNFSAFCCASCSTSMVYRRMARADPWNPAKSNACQCCELGNQICCKLCDFLK